MKVTVYGTEICIDCVQAKELLKNEPSIDVVYKDITENTKNLKEFLTLRDNDPMFEEIKKESKIGIPFFILEDGTKTFDITPYIKEVKGTINDNISCSIDGKGC